VLRAPPMRDLLAVISLTFFVVVPVGTAVIYYYDVLVYHDILCKTFVAPEIRND
jgi:hypothetical protein